MSEGLEASRARRRARKQEVLRDACRRIRSQLCGRCDWVRGTHLLEENISFTTYYHVISADHDSVTYSFHVDHAQAIVAEQILV